jgi:hypothetical protein
MALAQVDVDASLVDVVRVCIRRSFGIAYVTSIRIACAAARPQTLE